MKITLLKQRPTQNPPLSGGRGLPARAENKRLTDTSLGTGERAAAAEAAEFRHGPGVQAAGAWPPHVSEASSDSPPQFPSERQCPDTRLDPSAPCTLLDTPSTIAFCPHENAYGPGR